MNPAKTLDQDPPEDPPEPPPGASDEDTYMDGEYLVFTAAFHLKRGYCCHSDCRHCPYKEPA